MAKLLQDCQDLSLWTLGAQKQGKLVTTSSLKHEDSTLIQLAPFAEASSIYTVFKPSGFAGNPDQDRCSILFTIPDSLREHIDKLKEPI